MLELITRFSPDIMAVRNVDRTYLSETARVLLLSKEKSPLVLYAVLVD